VLGGGGGGASVLRKRTGKRESGVGLGGWKGGLVGVVV
jgi:hypothetical protein